MGLEKTCILYIFCIFYNEYCSIQASLLARKNIHSVALRKTEFIIKLYKQRAARGISQNKTAELSSTSLEQRCPRHQFCSRNLTKRPGWSCPPKLCHTHCSVLVHARLPLGQPWTCFLCFHLKLHISFILSRRLCVKV